MTGSDLVVIPGLGEVTGTYDPSTKTTKFLGIPYGSLSKRWTRATPLERFPNGKHDGTKFGPICPQVYAQGMPSFAQMMIPSFQPNPTTTSDEFQCLNLNILKPETEGADLPVMVWIHGGAFTSGSNTELIYDGMEIVTASLKRGSPVIHVAINYRLGPLGFLSSTHLLDENNGKAVGNYGLFDQRLALQFVRDHIHAFGGSPSKITIFGESAGGASVHAHIISTDPLCAAAICQSGVVRTLGPLLASHPYQTGMYCDIAAHLGHTVAPSPDVLRAVPAMEIVFAAQKLFGNTIPIGLITDDSNLEGGFFPHGTDWVTPQPWLNRLMVGDCAVEGVIVALNMLRIPLPDLVSFLNSNHSLPQDVLAHYGLDNLKLETIPEMNPPLIARLISLQTATAFFGPSEEVIAHAKKDTTWVYRIDRPNKWGSGAFPDMAHHGIELVYLAGDAKRYPTIEPEVDSKLGDAMVQHWVDFGVDRKPWTATGESRVEMVYGVDGHMTEKKVGEIATRKYENASSVSGELAAKALTVSVALSSGFIRY